MRTIVRLWSARVIEKARRYFSEHLTSTTRLVTQFPDTLPEREKRLSPAVERLMGILPPHVDIADYHRHLEEKYGL